MNASLFHVHSLCRRPSSWFPSGTLVNKGGLIGLNSNGSWSLAIEWNIRLCIVPLSNHGWYSRVSGKSDCRWRRGEKRKRGLWWETSDHDWWVTHHDSELIVHELTYGIVLRNEPYLPPSKSNSSSEPDYRWNRHKRIEKMWDLKGFEEKW